MHRRIFALSTYIRSSDVLVSECLCGLQDAMEYAECEATVKSFLPFIEAMKKRGIDDMELVMEDAW